MKYWYMADINSLKFSWTEPASWAAILGPVAIVLDAAVPGHHFTSWSNTASVVVAGVVSVAGLGSKHRYAMAQTKLAANSKSTSDATVYHPPNLDY